LKGDHSREKYFVSLSLKVSFERREEMNKLIDTRLIYPLIAVVLVIALFFLYKKQARQAKVSGFGKYQGYSKELYDGNKRISDYLTLSDGTRLAYDLFLPTKKGRPASEPLPVLFKYTPYMRAFTIFDKDGRNLITFFMDLKWYQKAMLRIRYWLSDQGNLMDSLFMTNWLRNMVKHGYAIIVVERPGGGASFGVAKQSMETVASEENQILDWIASQPWCNGNIGMYGESQQAWCQFAAASTGNPHLKAIFPASSQLELYEALEYRGGIYNKAFNSFFARVVPYLENLATPVDSDKDGALLAQARQGRSGSIDGKTMAVEAVKYPFRDSVLQDGKLLWELMALYPLIERINRSGIPTYMTTGWYDIFLSDMFFWYNNLTVPKRLTVRPLDHSGMDKGGSDLDYRAEAQRWFDCWLKGIDNGIMKEPPIHYYVMDVPKREAWQTSNQWPLEKQKLTPFYFEKGKTGGVASANDGYLTTESPMVPNASDAYTVDYSTTTGKKSRWVAVEEAHHYPDMSSNDKRGLTYTTSFLETDMEVTGHPIVDLWLTTNASDLDVFVYLQEVDRSGKSIYITEGNLRASHRKLSQPPFNNLGLPYHSHYQSDFMPIPAGEPFELAFSLLPTSYRFLKGNRIRVTVAFADADNFETPVIDPAPKLHLLRDVNHPSLVQLPVALSR
jgi:putative CocE/NonD family hydrolase